MKKLLLMLLTIGMISCTKKEMPEPEKPKDKGSMFDDDKPQPIDSNKTYWNINDGPKTDLDYVNYP